MNIGEPAPALAIERILRLTGDARPAGCGFGVVVSDFRVQVCRER